MDRFLIAPAETGLQLNMPAWLTMDDSFQQLNNAYVWRGRVRKRFGTDYTGIGATGAQRPLYSRLSIPLGVVPGTGNFTATPVPGAITSFAIGQMFSVDDNTYTVVTNVAPYDLLRSDGVAAVATFDFTTGNLVLNNVTVGSTVYYYPTKPVMGLLQYNTGDINNHPSYAFDTQFIYRFTTRWIRDGAVVFHGDDTQFFWGSNYIEETTGYKTLFVTNFNASLGVPPATDDPIYYLRAGAWTAFTPIVTLAHNAFVAQARLIVNFKGRLLLLNTIENDGPIVSGGTNTNTAYPNRCRFSWYGQSAVAAAAFYEPGEVGYQGGGYIDAPTYETIISAQFIKDRLIVYFERSTFELAYTGNQLTPFVWNKLNTELGSQSPFSTVPFDQAVLTCGNSGFHSCNGSNVIRIDDKIPDEVINIKVDNSDNERICSIRDYATEVVYWSYKTDDIQPTQSYPNRTLTYNYKNGSWATNDETITAFGYFEQNTGKTWADYTDPWQAWTAPWNSGVAQAGYRQTLAGNQFGFVFTIQRDNPKCAAVHQITQLTSVYAAPYYTVTVTAPNHNLQGGDYIAFYDPNILSLNFNFRNAGYEVTVLTADTFTIQSTYDPFTLLTPDYTGNVYFRRLPCISIYSKQWNPYVKDGRDVYVAKIDFGVVRTADGSCTIDYYASSGYDSTIYNGGTPPAGTGMLLGNSQLSTAPYPTITKERNASRLWHPVYMQNEGQCIQIQIYLEASQLANLAIVDSDFVLEGLILHCTPTTARLY